MKLLSILISVLTIILYHRPRTSIAAVMLWVPKLLSGAFAPVQALLGGIIGLYGFVKRDWLLFGLGGAAAALNAFHVKEVTQDHSNDLFASAFGPDWQAAIPPEVRTAFMPRPWQPILSIPDDAAFQQDLVVGEKFNDGPLLADLWQPRAGAYRSGMAILYTHGGAWRYGRKDMMTRPQFKWLAHQGHVILDIDYDISANASIQEMVRESKQALLWLKAQADVYAIDPKRIVLMGESAGGHLALLAAYTPGHLAFTPANIAGDESVHGVIALYPPTDFLQLYHQGVDRFTAHSRHTSRMDMGAWYSYALMKSLGLAETRRDITEERNFITELLGGAPDQAPEVYRLLSPINHVSPASPPTLMIIGEHDFFHLNPGVHDLHFKLKGLGVPAPLLELPRTDHAFDLVLTAISPPAQTAIYHLERFLGILMNRG